MTPPAAPFLTAADLCSDCKAKPVMLDRGAMRVCPNCFALLWHEDYSAAERARKDELREQHTTAERNRRQLRDLHRREQAERREQARMQMFEKEPKS